MKRILLVEDDFALAKSLKEALKIKNYQTDIADNMNQAEFCFRNHEYHLIILDIQLPDGNGIELCQKIRMNSLVPILFLTANDNEDVLVEGLNSGGDDYMTKPFRVKELYARVAALIRRTQFIKDVIYLGDLKIDIARQEVLCHDKCLILSSIDFELLKLLVTHSHQVLTRRQLIEAIEKDQYYIEDNTLSVHMKRLRDKLGTYHGISYIETVRGVGYRIQKEVLYEDE